MGELSSTTPFHERLHSWLRRKRIMIYDGSNLSCGLHIKRYAELTFLHPPHPPISFSRE